MKFLLDKKEISKYTSYLGHIVDPKPSLPVLGNILIEASKDTVTFTATNLEITIQTSIKAKVEETGTTTVPARTFSDLMSSLTDENITISKEGQILHVVTQTTETQFNTMNAENFPETLKTSEDPLLVLSVEEFKKSMEKVVFSAGMDSTNPVFCGIFFDNDETGLSLVSTDGYRLSRYIIKTEDKPKNLPWLVPVKAIKEMLKIITNYEPKELIKFYSVGENKQILMQIDDVKIYTRIIDGEYPDYRAVIPSTSQTKASFNFGKFKEALRQVNIFARDMPGNKVVITLDSKEQKLYMEATLSEVGSNKSMFEAQIDGADLKVIFSAKSLTDLCNTLNDETLLFASEGSESAGVFKIPSEENYLHIIMPLSSN